MCASWTQQLYGHNILISDHIQEFYDIYVKPYTTDSDLYEDRLKIRESPFLNKLLFDNNSGLRLIYERYKSKEHYLFCIESVYEVFSYLDHEDFYISRTQLKLCFVECKQTVQDELRNSDYY